MMPKYLIKQVLKVFFLLFIISVICFALMQAAPYDVVDAMASPDKPREVLEQLRDEYGLNRFSILNG